MKSLSLLFLLLVIPTDATERSKAAPGFAWRDFPAEHVTLQVPDGWIWAEKDSRPAKTLAICTSVHPSGGYDTGLTLNAVICRTEKAWRDAYLSSLKLWAAAADEIKVKSKPTFEKVTQEKNKAGEIILQVMIVEGDVILPQAPHPRETYRVRTIVRAYPAASVVYFYTFGALVKDWDAAWKDGATMLDSIDFHLPE